MPHGLLHGEIVALACFARSPADPDNTMAQRHLLHRGFASSMTIAEKVIAMKQACRRILRYSSAMSLAHAARLRIVHRQQRRAGREASAGDLDQIL